MEGGNVRFSMKKRGEYTAHVFSCEFCEIFKNTFFSEHVRATVTEYSRIELCVNIAQLIIFHILQHHVLMNTRALFSFSSTIDGNTDTVHLIEGFVF